MNSLPRAQACWDDLLPDDPPEDPVRAALEAQNTRLRELLASALQLIQEAGDKLQRIGPAAGEHVQRELEVIKEELACVTP